MDPNKSVNECDVIVKKMNAEIVNAYFPVIIYLIISMVIGAIGNVFVTLIYYHKFYTTSTKIFIITLSICDFLTCTICIPMELTVLYYSYVFYSDVACRVIRFCVSAAITASSMTVFVIAVDRYLLICKPFTKKISVRNAKKILIVLIISSFFISIPALILFGHHYRMVEQCGNAAKDCSLSTYTTNNIVYFIIYYSILIVICYSMFISILIIYILIAKSVWRIYVAKKSKSGVNFDISLTSSASTQGDERHSSLHSQHYALRSLSINKVSMNPVRTSFILLIITLIWIVTYVPHFVGVFRKVTKNFTEFESNRSHLIYRCLLYSAYLSSAVNPLIYGIFSEKFRNEVYSIFRSLHRNRQ